MGTITGNLERIKEAYKVKKYTELAEIMGIKYSTIDNWKKRDIIPEKYFLKCAEDTGFSYNYLKTGEKDLTDTTIEALFFPDTYAAAGTGAINYHDSRIAMRFDKELLKTHFAVDDAKQLHVIEAIGDSMEPTINPSDLLFILPLEDSNTQIVDNAIYIISAPNGVLVKRIKLHPVKTSIDLISDNPTVEDITLSADELLSCKILGRVVSHMARL